MDTDELEELRGLTFMQSRIPPLDALEVFVPTGEENDPRLNEVRSRTGFSRWFPVEGGHRVLILYEGGGYDESRFRLIKGGWDHEHCKRCLCKLEPMTLCWTTTEGPLVILCADCHATLNATPE